MVGTCLKKTQARIGSIIKIEVMEATLTIQIFLKALKPSIYPATRKPPATVIIKKTFKNIDKNDWGAMSLFLAPTISAYIDTASPIKISKMTNIFEYAIFIALTN